MFDEFCRQFEKQINCFGRMKVALLLIAQEYSAEVFSQLRKPGVVSDEVNGGLVQIGRWMQVCTHMMDISEEDQKALDSFKGASFDLWNPILVNTCLG